MPVTAPLPQVRKSKRYTSEELLDACQKAVKADGRTQVQLAEAIGKSAGTVSRALTDGTGRYASTQADLIAETKGYRVVKHDPPAYWMRAA